MRTLIFLLIFAVAAGTAVASEADRSSATDPRALMLQALASPDGGAHGVLVGPAAEAITRRFKATGPLLIDVTTLHRLPTAGCARLNVHFSQQGVQLPQASPAPRSLDIGLNLCRDGRAPPAPAATPGEPAGTARPGSAS